VDVLCCLAGESVLLSARRSAREGSEVRSEDSIVDWRHGVRDDGFVLVKMCWEGAIGSPFVEVLGRRMST